ILDGTGAVTGTAPTNTDSIYFGTNNLTLGSTASTIGIVGTGVTINNIVFGNGLGSQAVTLGATSALGTITLAAASTITVNNTSDTIGVVLAGAGTSMTKAGRGTLTLTGANTYTGTTTISGGGSLTVGNGSSGSLIGTALTFNAGGGTLNVAEAASSTQGMGALTFSAGDGSVISTAASGGSTAALSFASLAARVAGATENFSLATNTTAGQNKIVLTSPTNAPVNGSGSNNQGVLFGGADYARYDTTAGYFRAVTYGTDNNASALIGTAAILGINDATKDVKISGNITAQTTASVNTLNLGANNFTLQNTTQILSVNGILSAGASAAALATAGKIQSTSSGGELVIRVNGSTDALNIAPIIQNNGAPASALTKSGAGTLTLSSANTYTGTTTINAGTLALSGGSAIVDTGAVVLANAPGSTLLLNANETIGSLAGGGFSGGNVNVQGNTLTLANANSLTFGGAFSGTSGGGVTLTSGTLTLSNKNSFAGTITLMGTSQLTLTYGSDGTANIPSISSGGTISMAGGTSLLWNPTAQVAAGVAVGTQGGSVSVGDVVSNPIIVSSGTAAIKQGSAGGRYVFSGGVTGGTSGTQTLSIIQGFGGGNAERTTFTFSGIIQNGSGGTLGVNADFKSASGTGQGAFICLSGQNSFTGPIAVSNSKGLIYDGGISTYHGAWFVIGGEITSVFGDRTVTPGSGYLGGGNFSGTISLATGTILDYASSQNQTLGGVISGTGNLVKEGSGTLTLSAANTYTGNTTVTSGGMLTVATTGGLKFVVTDATANKVTGTGSATINGTFTIDTSAVTVTTGSWTLVDATTKSFGGTFNLTGFTGSAPVFTKVIGSQSWSFNTTTGVLTLTSLLPSTACAMLTCDFGVLGQAVISEASGIASLTVSPSQVLTALAPVFSVSPKATISPASGSTHDFTSSVVYRVTAENGTTYKDYTVSVQSYAAWAYSGSFFILT
ncbi:MAG: autotransporter-associated beta strand repeat-containing protein, partial [Verrucomicrobiota bacterium]